jgi:hypothetical protein
MMNYTGIITWPRGAAVRPEPHTWNNACYILDYMQYFEFDVMVQDSAGNGWAYIPAANNLPAGWLALQYGGKARADYWQIDAFALPENLWRVKHDYEQPPYFTARVNQPGWKNPRMKQAPEVFPLYETPHTNSAGGRVNMSAMETWLRELSGNDRRKWNYYINDHSGLYNRNGWPKMELLIFGGALVYVEMETDNWCRIAALPAGQVPSATVTPWRTPWLVQRFAVVTASNTIIDPPPGVIFSPLVANCDLWIQKSRLVKVEG